ncbi:PPOX class F420-dependent oxidoreductase [Streptomyces sp. NPDC091217]|uniref:PPOX class F420-dependent oxidoreductase n=1 Tax=Streptomyces sp. NPDC091217 TaxID=3365975 RepID=UPI0037FE342D
MSVFTDNEVAYLQSQPICRLATANAAGHPHVVPTGFHVDPEQGVLKIGAHDLEGGERGQKRLYRRNIEANPYVAVVVDDLASTRPWAPRGITVRGRAEIMQEGGGVLGPGFGPVWIRIVPTFVSAWGIDTDAFAPPNNRRLDA